MGDELRQDRLPLIRVCLRMQALDPMQYWGEVLSLVTTWMTKERASTTGTMSVLRQVTRWHAHCLTLLSATIAKGCAASRAGCITGQTGSIMGTEFSGGSHACASRLASLPITSFTLRTKSDLSSVVIMNGVMLLYNPRLIVVAIIWLSAQPGLTVNQICICITFEGFTAGNTNCSGLHRADSRSGPRGGHSRPLERNR